MSRRIAVMRAGAVVAWLALAPAAWAQSAPAPDPAPAPALRPIPALRAPSADAVTAPAIVVGGVPAPDPGVARVGPCVWAALSGEEREALAASAGGSRTEPWFELQYPSPIVAGAVAEPVLRARARACDANLGAHWRYSMLAAGAHVEVQVSSARLAAAGVDLSKLNKAWGQAPAALRDGHQRLVAGYLDGNPPEGPLPDWKPLYRALKLKDAPPDRAGAAKPLSSAQAALRDYMFARDLEALIVGRMSAPAVTEPVAADVWTLDYKPDLARFFPQRASQEGLAGRGVAECTLTDDGGLVDCVPVQEAPADWGFGAATARAASRFRFRVTGAAKAAVGKRVLVPIRWSLPD